MPSTRIEYHKERQIWPKNFDSPAKLKNVLMVSALRKKNRLYLNSSGKAPLKAPPTKLPFFIGPSK